MFDRFLVGWLVPRWCLVAGLYGQFAHLPPATLRKPPPTGRNTQFSALIKLNQVNKPSNNVRLRGSNLKTQTVSQVVQPQGF
jgi:hypothetical protein